MNRVWADALVALLVAATETILELVKRIKKKGGTAIVAVVCVIGPSAIWRITKVAAEWLLVIMVLVWAL